MKIGDFNLVAHYWRKHGSLDNMLPLIKEEAPHLHEAYVALERAKRTVELEIEALSVEHD